MTLHKHVFLRPKITYFNWIFTLITEDNMLQMLCTFSHVNTSSWISPISEHKEYFCKCFLSSYFPTHKIIFSGQLCEAIRRAVSVEWMRVLNYGKCYYGNCIDQLYFSERKLVLPGKNVAENTFLLFQASTSKENVNYLMIHQIQTRVMVKRLSN